MQVPANSAVGTQILTVSTPDALQQEATLTVGGSVGATGVAGRLSGDEFGSYRPEPIREGLGKVPVRVGRRR